jgi:hypothetical protein
MRYAKAGKSAVGRHKTIFGSPMMVGGSPRIGNQSRTVASVHDRRLSPLELSVGISGQANSVPFISYRVLPAVTTGARFAIVFLVHPLTFCPSGSDLTVLPDTAPPDHCKPGKI